VLLSAQGLSLTIQLKVAVVGVKMREIALEIPTQKGSAWRNFELQNHGNTVTIQEILPPLLRRIHC
jgi:hypothetical protein